MNKTILIVEDDPSNRMLLRDVLQHDGYETLEAANGEDALQLALAHVPDLILMDIQMPVMDGTTAVRKLKQDPRTNRIPVIALTALAMDGDEDTAFEAGYNGYITKPIDIHLFLETVSSYL